MIPVGKAAPRLQQKVGSVCMTELKFPQALRLFVDCV